MKKINIYILLALSLLLGSCDDVLDKEYLRAINPDDIWNSKEMAGAYVNNFYGKVMPGWPDGSSYGTDEGVGIDRMSDIFKGIATIDAVNYWPYDKIRTINIFLENIDKGSILDDDKKPLKGQMLFWRAWLYHGMVKNYGGVPLILDVKDPNDPAIFASRSKTSECVAQIIKDIDEAITLLPSENWTGGDVGRIDRSAAMAFKGRVELFYASPLFNPANDQAKWQKAYDANKAALTYAESKGKGLYDDFANIWQNELNKEVIMVRRFHNPGGTFFQGGLRPISFSKDQAFKDIPSLQLANAFPMKDGSEFDETAGYVTMHLNRDNRFYTTIAHNGTNTKFADMVKANTYLWTYFKPDGGAFMNPSHPSPTSFYRLKGLDRTITQSTVYDATVDWVEIRFAEVLMNYGEAANEIGKASEALDVLYKIRKRAGIDAGADNKYGITATTKEEIREAFFKERFVEFAFEGKRWSDIRRLRKYDYLNSLTRRKGLKISLKSSESEVSGTTDIFDAANYNKFTAVVNDIDPENINILDKYYFFAIPKDKLERNSKLEQTKGWDNGTFDPLL